MRKTIFTALIVLLVLLAVVSCDSLITEPEGEKPEYTADGRKLVTLKVKVGGTSSRALSSALAQGAANYMEVIFKDEGATAADDMYYRTAGLMFQTLSISIPANTYSESNAILLVGKKGTKDGKDHYVLLATGKPSAATGTVPNTNNTIVFELTSLTADLYAGGTPTFTIEEDKPDDAAGPPAVVSLKNQGFTAAKIKDSTFGSTGVACFQVPVKTKGIEAALAISGFNNTTANIEPAKYTSGTTSSDIVTIEPEIKFSGVAKSGDDTDDDGVGEDPPDIDVDTDDIAFSVTGGVGTISFSFDTTTKGDYIITFDIPVVGFAVYFPGLAKDALSPGDPDPALPPTGPGTLRSQLIWHIHGGTSLAPTSFQPLEGSGEEGVALAVRPKALKMVPITIGPVLPDDL